MPPTWPTSRHPPSSRPSGPGALSLPPLCAILAATVTLLPTITIPCAAVSDGSNATSPLLIFLLLIALVVTSGQRFWEVIFFCWCSAAEIEGEWDVISPKEFWELYFDLALKWSPCILGYSPSFNIFSFFNFLRQRYQNWSNHCKRVLHQDSLMLSVSKLQLWLLLLILIKMQLVIFCTSACFQEAIALLSKDESALPAPTVLLLLGLRH